MAQLWDIYIFTASCLEYAKAICNLLDPEKIYIKQIINKSSCMETNSGFLIKDLRILKDIDLAHTIIVDNLVHSFGFQIQNGIPILSWYDDKEDMELLYMMEYLREISTAEDVRIFNNDRLKLQKLVHEDLFNENN